MGPTSKTCSICKVEKPRTEFYKRKDVRDGLKPYCKPCTYERYGASDRAYAKARYHEVKKDQQEARDRRLYGLSAAEADAIRAQPCEICGKSAPSVVDHCHETGRVRGPLCNSCNRAIGLLNDSPELLANAIDYLRRSL